MGKKVKQPKKIVQEEVESSSDEEDLQDEFQQDQIEQENKEDDNKIKINKEMEMQNKIQEIQNDFKRRLKIDQKTAVNWHEHMSLVGDTKVELTKMDINDDIQREVQFYNIALENAKLAVKYLASENIPIRRPDDYFADMYKNDRQMSKIKNRLVQQQVKVQNFEEKQLREQSKKLSKKIKARQEFAKQKEKKDNLNAIDDWKKEISKKGEHAKDLSEFMLKKGPKRNNQQQQQSKDSKGNLKGQNYTKHAKNSGGGKKALPKGGKTIQKDGNKPGAQKGKGNAKGQFQRPGKGSRGKGKSGGKKKGKRGHQ